MKNTIKYIFYLLGASWLIGISLLVFYPSNVEIDWQNIYMWTPASLTILWLLFKGESINVLKWNLRKPWWFYIIAVYLPLVYIIPEIFCQQSSGFITYDFSSLSVPKELGIKIPFSALVGLVIPVLGEELAWRGYLQDKLVKSLGQTNGIFTLGLVWAIWHIPELIRQESWLFTAFVFFPVACISLSFLIFWAMKKCNSIWIAVIIHASNNYIWNLMSRSGTINNDYGAKITSLIIFILTSGVLIIILNHMRNKEKPAPNIL